MERFMTEVGTLELTYRLNITHHGNILFYGITVTETDETGQAECKEIYDISSDKTEIEKLISLLKAGHVTAVTVEDIVQDFLE